MLLNDVILFFRSDVAKYLRMILSSEKSFSYIVKIKVNHDMWLVLS